MQALKHHCDARARVEVTIKLQYRSQFRYFLIFCGFFFFYNVFEAEKREKSVRGVVSQGSFIEDEGRSKYPKSFKSFLHTKPMDFKELCSILGREAPSTHDFWCPSAPPECSTRPPDDREIINISFVFSAFSLEGNVGSEV